MNNYNDYVDILIKRLEIELQKKIKVVFTEKRKNYLLIILIRLKKVYEVLNIARKNNEMTPLVKFIEKEQEIYFNTIKDLLIEITD